MKSEQLLELNSKSLTLIYVLRQESGKTCPYIEIRNFVRFAPKDGETLNVEHEDPSLPGCKAWASQEDVFLSWYEAKHSDRYKFRREQYIEDAKRQIENLQESIYRAQLNLN